MESKIYYWEQYNIISFVIINYKPLLSLSTLFFLALKKLLNYHNRGSFMLNTILITHIMAIIATNKCIYR